MLNIQISSCIGNTISQVFVSDYSKIRGSLNPLHSIKINFFNITDMFNYYSTDFSKCSIVV